MATSDTDIALGLADFDARALRFLLNLTRYQVEVRAGRMTPPAPFDDPTLQAAWDAYSGAPSDHIERLRDTAASRLTLQAVGAAS